jgi:hypothetical protein
MNKKNTTGITLLLSIIYITFVLITQPAAKKLPFLILALAEIIAVG